MGMHTPPNSGVIAMGTHTPPNPGVTGDFIRALQSGSFEEVGPGHGRIRGYVLTVESAGADRVRWALIAEDAPESSRFVPRLITRAAYDALARVSIDEHGTAGAAGGAPRVIDAVLADTPIADLEDI